MAKIISFHSFRGGTGKSNITANIAFLLSSLGKRVAIIDGDITSPGIHILYGLQNDTIPNTLNDYLCGRSSIKEASIDVSKKLGFKNEKSKLFIIPSSLTATEITQILREGYSVERLVEGFHQIIEDLQLDYLIIDTHPGIREETLIAISISHTLFVIMRPDSQDYEGTAILLELAKKLEVPKIYIIINKLLPAMDPASIREKVEETYEVAVAASIPFCEEIMVLGSADLFAKKYPDHSITADFKAVVSRFL